MSRKRREGAAFKEHARKIDLDPATSMKEGDKDWNHKCELCDSLPTVHPTGLCGPCCFGEAATANGNW